MAVRASHEMQVAAPLHPSFILTVSVAMAIRALREWKRFYGDRGIRPDLAQLWLSYAEHMLAAGLPPIFEFRHLASLLGRTPTYLASIVNAPEAHYRTFRIPKRRGGTRTISAPYSALLECQQWIHKLILSSDRVHPYVHGFRRKRSILTNARPHLGQRCLLKMDLRDFFPSISLQRVIGVFRRLGYVPNVAFYLARICCLDDALPQGAATSPALSNLVAGRMDARLAGLTKRFGLHYTRYADDLTFSGERISLKTVEILSDVIGEEGFTVNEGKTRLCRSGGKRVVTGISVRTTEPRLPKSYKRRVRQEAYYVWRFGIRSHASKRRIRNPFYIDSIYGKLLFWKWVEPDNRFVSEFLPRIQSLL